MNLIKIGINFRGLNAQLERLIQDYNVLCPENLLSTDSEESEDLILSFNDDVFSRQYTLYFDGDSTYGCPRFFIETNIFIKSTGQQISTMLLRLKNKHLINFITENRGITNGTPTTTPTDPIRP